MTRRTEIVSIDLKGRDHGKRFLITEMPAAQAEKWAMRAFLAMARNGVDIPDDIAESGLAGIAALGIKALGSVSFDDAELLADEMFQCVQAMPDPTNDGIVTRLFPDSIEEIATRLFLRKRVFGLHVDFSSLVAPLKSAGAAVGSKKA